MQAAGETSGPEAGAGKTTAPTGSTMFCSSCGPSGTRSGLSSNGGAMSTPVTELPAIAMRMVRVICELAAMVANVAGETWPATIEPWPAEAPRALAKSLARPVSLASARIE